MAERALPSWGYIAVGAVGAVALVVFPMSIFGPPTYRDPARLTVMSLIAASAVAWSVIFSWLAFRRQDEFAQNASKFAWYWGGSIGLAASIPIFAFLAWGGLHWLAPSVPAGTNILRALLVGYLLPVFAQVTGILVARAYWRLSTR
jgi:hypothetical protein